MSGDTKTDRALDEIRYEKHRRKYLPEAIATAERKLAGLYREARRYEMDELLEDQACVNAAWDREVAHARLRNTR